MRIALINPPPARNLGQIGEETPYPSLSLGYLSAVLTTNNVENLLVDAVFERWDLDEVVKHVSSFQPDIIGLTSMTHEIKQAVFTAKLLKGSYFPNALYIIGGSHATIAPIRTLKQFHVFDVAVIGEGEETIVGLIGSLELKSVKGIAYRLGNKIRVNESREFIQELDSLPYPNFDDVTRHIDIYPLFSSRGCPYQCIFCNRILGNRLRVRSPENVVDEMEYAIKKYNPEEIRFLDDQFIIPLERALKICDLITERNINVNWNCLSRVDGVSRAVLRKMKKAGCVKIDFGVESGNQDILKIIKKRIKVKDALDAVKWAKEAGMETGSFFIIGHPYETLDTIDDTISLATRLNTDTVSFGIMVPYPGTGIYDMALKGEGNYKLLSEDWDDFDKQIGGALELTNLSRKDLEKAQLKAYVTFYLRNFRFVDFLKVLFTNRKLVGAIVKKVVS